MAIKQNIVLAFLLLLSNVAFGQKAEKVILFKEDPYKLYNDGQANTSNLFYLKLVPKVKPIGCLVILPSSGELVEDVMKQITLHKLAVGKGFLVIFPSLNWGTNTFIEEHKFLDIVFRQVVEKYKIPKDKFILGGLSGGGMISLTYTEKANRDRASTFVVPKAVFALDPPLDYTHLYNHAKRDVERNFSAIAVNEGNWLMDGFKKEFGGTPEEVPSAYIKYSIYSHGEKDGGNAKYLLKTPVKIYVEPGIEWQIKNRHRDLYDSNCLDITALINYLQINGNKNADIVVTHDKGVRLNGSKHPHSWSIMNSQDCLTWILRHLN